MKKHIAVKWFPPSWFQVIIGPTIVYLDPAYLKTNFAQYPYRIEFSKWPEPIDGLPEELNKGDLILVTHHHKDHCKKVTVDRLKKESTQILAPEICCQELGPDVRIVKPGEVLEMASVEIQVVDAYNVAHERQAKIVHKKGKGVGYLLNIGGKKMYHAGDTDLIPEMGHFGPIDLALLPIGGRGFTMDINQALEAVKILKPQHVIPMHRFEADAEDFKKRVEKQTDARVIVLTIGETFKL